MPDTFTIFNHGTKSHRGKQEHELITRFGAQALGAEYEDYLITDGPGARTKKDRSNPMAGTFDPYTKNKQPKKRFPFPNKADFMKPKTTGLASGLLMGEGWDDNVIHAMATIANLDAPPRRVNMIGWSRGAVTCLKMAHRLQEVYPTIDVNIFAVDPVAGPRNGKAHDTTIITPNVRNYVGTLAIHENRGAYAPQDLSRVDLNWLETGRNNVMFLPFPGAHGTQVYMKSDVARIVWSLALQFLDHHGSQFVVDPADRRGERDFLDLYTSVVNGPGPYRKMKHWGPFQLAQGGLCKRSFAKQLGNYVQDENYFLNRHHRAVFKSLYPNLFSWLFSSVPVQAASAVNELRCAPLALVQSLEALGIDPGDRDTLPERVPRQAGGRDAVADCRALGLL